MKKLKEGLKVHLTLEKLIKIIVILSAVYTGGSKLWADKTEVEIIKVEQKNIYKSIEKIEIRQEKMAGQIDLIHAAFVAAAKK